jgi:secreted PhoX family phosphatase
LFVAKFHPDKRGEWLPLTPETTGLKSAAEICVHTRIAGSAVKATPMDRPEWICARPDTSEVYCSLTNNIGRGAGKNLGGQEMLVDGPNPRAINAYGQILRLNAKNDDHCHHEFEWDLFLVAGNPLVHEDKQRGSTNINATNMFNGPDGLRFDSQDRLWIQTDGDTSNTGKFLGHGNNQMLIGNPNTGEIRRFLTGPKGCEITGLCWNDDRTAMFVGIQHPGKDTPSEFPDGKGSMPKSSVIVVTHSDGDRIG